MTPKATSHVIQGMQKDTSKSKLSKEFAFDAKNIRITAREDNTLLTITNEKGNSKLIDLSGYYIGHCVLNNQLVLFTTTPNAGNNKDHIFLHDSEFNQTTLYNGNLNFSLDNPLETLGVYENEDIQKVYWVDGRNQPRVINIKASEEVRSKWSDTSFDFIPELALQESVYIEAISNSSLFAPGVIQYAFSYYNKYGQESNIFDVTPLCYLAYNNRGANPEEIIRDRAFKIKVSNLDTNFEYVRIYSIHRTSLNSTPTVKRIIDLPISIPEETTEIKESVSSYNIANNYTIGYYSTDFKYDSLPLDNIKEYETTNGNIIETTYSFSKSSIEVDPNNQYLILYDENSVEKERIKVIGTTFYITTEKVILPGSNREIIRKTLTSKNTDTIFITTKIQYNNTVPSIEYIDNGTLGETIDPTQLLYIGGEDIIAGTITQKDGTLFLGNIELKQLPLQEELKSLLKNNTITPQIKYLNTNKKDVDSYHCSDIFINDYSYFKAGEHYRLGVQLQYKNGKWSEPIFIQDYIVPIGSNPVIEDSRISFPSMFFSITETVKNNILNHGFKRIRGLVVFPEEHERRIVAQGMLCPTIYNLEDRRNNNPYTQSSWFIRPNLPVEITYDSSGNEIENPFSDINNENINSGSFVEFRHGKSLIKGDNRGSEIQNNTEYIIDQSIITFHSPDVEFNPNSIISPEEDIDMRIVGFINFTYNYGDIDIQTSTPTKVVDTYGFNKKQFIDEEGSKSLVAGLFYNDASAKEEDINKYYYLVYPWNKSGSLNDDNSSLASSEERIQSSILKIKKISNLKFSKFNTWLSADKVWNALGGNTSNSLANGISKVKEFNSNQMSLIKVYSNFKDEYINYFGNVDTLKTISSPYNLYKSLEFTGELSNAGTSTDPVRIKYKSSRHLIFRLNNTSINKHEVILPNINNLNKVSHIIIEGDSSPTLKNCSLALFKAEFTGYTRHNFPKDAIIGDLCIGTHHIDHDTANGQYQKYDRIVVYKKINSSGDEWENWEEYTGDCVYYFVERNIVEVYTKNSYNWTFKGKENLINEESTETIVKQDTLNIEEEYSPKYPYLYLAELYRPQSFIQNAFGGLTEDAIKNNLWTPASRSHNLENIGEGFIYEYGDTRYQRYDCLKTYAFTPEDENQVVEIASFMCETRVNMLGRYDKNIGNLSNLNADPTNFNLFNSVYSQRDNFFNYRILDSDLYKLDKFTNTITWSKEKHLGEDVDTWTNITMASTLDLDGTKGKVNKLLTFKDQIFAFQDKGISNILFNSRVQIPVSDGVPVEISNGMKVDGSRYISDNIGCQNKNSIVATPSGVYFLDSESNGVYLLADGLTNLSTNKGFDIWTKEVSKDPSFKSLYDKNEKDVYFTTKDYCLGYSEKLGQFTSFYDYNDVETMFNIGTGFYSIKANSKGDQSIYQHSVGNYNEFYGEIKPYYLTIISNDDPQVDKVFTNLDYRADFFDSKNNYLENESFDTLEVWNEYQSGKEVLKYSKFRPSNLKKKFRMWGANIPRDKKNKLDRMRNPWLYIKLSKEKPGTSKMELHDLVVKYLE